MGLLLLLGLPFKTKILTVKTAATEETYNFTFLFFFFFNFFQFRFDFVCEMFFLNHLAPPSKGEHCDAEGSFYSGGLVHVTSLNLIAFISSIETETFLLAPVKSTY